MPSSHLILCHPLFLLPPILPSIRVFSNESTLRMRWPEYWSFSVSIIPSKEHPGLISFRMNWLDLLAVHGTLKSLLLHQLTHVKSATLHLLSWNISWQWEAFRPKKSEKELHPCIFDWGILGGSDGEESAYNVGGLVPSLGQEDLLGEGIATYSSILTWRIPMDRGVW